MKFLLQNNSIIIQIRWITVMFKIFLYHFISYIPCTPNSITYRPKMSSPIFFAKLRIFFLQSSRCSTFKPFYNITDVLRRAIFNMDMYMVFTYYSFKYSNIFNITYLFYQFPTSYLNITFENLISILGYPNYMSCKNRDGMTTSPLCFHNTKLIKCVATESLALKVHSFN